MKLINMKLLVLFNIFNIITLVTSFLCHQGLKPYHKAIGKWNLVGSSNEKYNKANVIIRIMPTKKEKLSVTWIKQTSLGLLVIKDCLKGDICVEKCESVSCVSNYSFKAKNYQVSLIDILGIEIPKIINIQKPLTEKCNKDVYWNLDNNLLLVNIEDNDYVFTRDIVKKETSNSIRLDYFIISQLLGYILIKEIEKIHLLRSLDI
jgi:hypothetical protein